MKSIRLRNIFVSVIFLITLFTGALFENVFTKAGLVFAASEDTKGDQQESGKAVKGVPDGEKTIIRIASWYQEYDLANLQAYLARQFPKYEFEYVYIEKNNYAPIMDSQLSYKGAPDIIYMDQEMVEKHVLTRYIANLTDICGDFASEAQVAFGYGNAVYAVPNTSQFECIYYNKDLFREKGVQVPYSYQSFIGSCDNLRIVKKIKPIAVSLKNPYAVSNSLLAVVSADYFGTDRGSGFGGRIQYGRTNFTKEFTPFMADWEELVRHEVFTKEMYTKDSRTALEEFASGKAAMILGGPETYNAIIRMRPDMNMGTLPFFSTRARMKAMIGGCDVGLALNANAMHFDEAKEVLKSLTTPAGQYALWQDRPGSQTYLKKTQFENSEVYKELTECREQGLVFSPWMDWGAELNGPIHYQLGVEMQKVILGKQSCEDALAKVDKRVEEILSQDQ